MCKIYQTSAFIVSFLILLTTISCQNYPIKLGGIHPIPQEEIQNINSNEYFKETTFFLQSKFKKVFQKNLGKIRYGTQQTVAGKLYTFGFQLQNQPDTIIEGSVVIRPWVNPQEKLQFIQFKQLQIIGNERIIKKDGPYSLKKVGQGYSQNRQNINRLGRNLSNNLKVNNESNKKSSQITDTDKYQQPLNLISYIFSQRSIDSPMRPQLVVVITDAVPPK